MQNRFLNNIILWLVLIGAWLSIEGAHAFSEQEIPEDIEKLMGDWKPLQVTGDAIPWDVFEQTSETEECTIDDEGFDYCINKPIYSDALKVLDGQEVTLMGYMFPLGQSEKQSRFLLGPYPQSCPFHYHVGSNQIVEVVVVKPLAFSYEPIMLKGTLSLRFNLETGVFYYLEDARSYIP